MVIPFSFTFKNPTLHKCASASSHSKSSKFLILQFLVKCCKLYSVFKILSKVTYVRYFFLFQVCTTNVHINYDFVLSKSLNSPNLYISWANIWYPDYQNRNLNLCMLNSFKGFHLCIKWATYCGTLIINLGKNSICACYCKQMKTSFARIKYRYKICINNLSMSSYTYLLRQQW